MPGRSDPVDALVHRLRPALNVYYLGYDTVRDLGKGSVFPTTGVPGGLLSGDRFFRTDLDRGFHWTGGNWLADDEQEIDFQLFGLVSFPYSGAAPQTLLIVPQRTDQNSYILRGKVYLYVNAVNNGTNYWSFQVQDDSSLNLWGFNTSADAAGVIQKEQSIVTSVTSGAKYLVLQITAKTGAPGSIGAAHLALWRRHII